VMCGNVFVLVVVEVLGARVEVVLLTRPAVATAEPSRDGRRANGGARTTTTRPAGLANGDAASLYLRGELPWYRSSVRRVCEAVK
jgi:hypothetical protein